MKRNLPRSVKDIKGKVALAELRRTHYIVVILALAFGFLLTIEAWQPLQLNGWLVLIADTLLVVVAAVSLSTAIVLAQSK